MVKAKAIEGADNITCPHCGHEDRNSWERDSEDGNTECGECEKPFYYVRHTTIFYSTYPRTELDIIKEEIKDIKERIDRHVRFNRDGRTTEGLRKRLALLQSREAAEEQKK